MLDNKVVNVPANKQLSEDTIHALYELFSSASPQEIKQSLQDLIFFMLINTDPQWYPDNFKEIISRIYFLDQFLSTANQNSKSNEKSNV